MNDGDWVKYRVVVKSLTVRERKQRTSKKLITLRQGEIVVVKAFFNNTAKILEPVVGWIDVRSGTGLQYIKQISRNESRSPRIFRKLGEERRDGVDSMSSDSVHTSSASGSSASRSLSGTPPPVRRKNASILVIPVDGPKELVTVEGYYGMIIGRAIDTNNSPLYEIQLDGKTDPCLCRRESFEMLVPDIEELFKDDRLVKRRITREHTRHNRDSTKIPLKDHRKPFRRKTTRIRFHWSVLQSREPEMLVGRESPPRAQITQLELEEAAETLRTMSPSKVVKLLGEMMKRDLYDVSHKFCFSEEQLMNLSNDSQFQRGFILLDEKG